MVTNRSEILFLYDASWINPNGDPVDDNKPRIDEETSRNIVTDVRLKRTIRDYLDQYSKNGIFVKEISDENDYIQDAKMRADNFLIKDGNSISKKEISIAEMKKIINDNILKDCIDVRLFGVTLPVEKDSKNKSSITHTGPVQFKMGYSLHSVKLEYIKGTGAFASKSNQTQKTFREEYVLPYSLIAFYGIVNEEAAKYTNLSEEDIDYLMEGMWNGTKSLISRSKVGQIPRFLLRVIYKEEHFQIGELDKYVSLETEKNEEEIRDVADYVLNVTQLIDVLCSNKEKIESIEFALDSRVNFNVVDFEQELSENGLKVSIKKY